MSTRTLLDLVAPFKGMAVIDCIDRIKAIAAQHYFTVNVMDPQFNTGSIDEDPRRLNIRTDDVSVIKSFSVG